LLAAESPLDFVAVCSPPASHVELVRQALTAGCHVLCEKPLALDLAALAELEKLSRAHKRALVTVHNWKYAPLYRAAQAALTDGLIGEVQEITWEVHRTSTSGGGLTDWRHSGAAAAGGILVDHGWHAFYLLLGLAAELPAALRAHLTPAPEDPQGVEHEAEVELRFPRARVRLFLTWRAKARLNRGRLLGTAGELLLEDDRLLRRRDGQVELVAAFPEKLSGGSHHPEWTRGSWEEFATEIRDPALRGHNLAEAGHCARLISLAYRSHAAGGAWLPYPPG
jgi:predicted dehydrogenase